MNCVVCNKEFEQNRYTKPSTCGSKSCGAKFHHMRMNNEKRSKRSRSISNGVKNQWINKRSKMIEGINKWHQSSNGISFHKTLSNKLNHSKGPNKLEQVFLNILNSWGFKFTFIGDGSEWIGNKNPDFINGNKIIDLFGEFWHKNDTDYKISKRINYLKSFGYDAIIVWSKELKDKEKLRIKIEEFVNG